MTKIFRASAFAASSDFSRASFSASLIGQFGGFLALAHNFIRHYQQKTPQFHGSWGNEVSQSRIHPTKSIIQDERNVPIEGPCWDAVECCCWKICIQTCSIQEIHTAKSKAISCCLQLFNKSRTNILSKISTRISCNILQCSPQNSQPQQFSLHRPALSP